MSISLKNIDDRLRQIESNKSAIVQLTRNPVFLKRTWQALCDISGYDCIFCVYTGGGDNGKPYPNKLDATNFYIFPTQIFKEHPHVNNLIRLGYLKRLDEYSLLKLDGNILKGYSTQNGVDPTDNIIMVWGLKLYYNFRAFIRNLIGSEVKYYVNLA